MTTDVNVDLRLLRYFVAVVDEGSITRAAARLTMSQPALSRAVRTLERSVGVDLLVREPQRVVPTPSGLALWESARDLDLRMRTAVADARAAGRTVPRLRVSATAGDVVLLAPLVRSFRESQPDDVDVEVLAEGTQEPAELVRAGLADVALVREPADVSGVEHEVVMMEPRVVLMTADHPLASRPHLHLDDLRDEPAVWYGWMAPEAARYWSNVGDWPDQPQGPVAAAPMDVATLVQLGQAVAYSGRLDFVGGLGSLGVVAKEVEGLTPGAVMVAWAEGATSLEVARFVAHAEDVLGPIDGSPRAGAPQAVND